MKPFIKVYYFEFPGRTRGFPTELQLEAAACGGCPLRQQLAAAAAACRGCLQWLRFAAATCGSAGDHLGGAAQGNRQGNITAY